MNKPVLVVAALGALSGVCSAQSSVTVFGVLDQSVRAVKNGDGPWTKALVDGALASSRFGFKGVEDLGGGLRASFLLDAPVTVDTGAAGTAAGATGAGGAVIAAKFFQRRSTVSLEGPWGEVRLGRDYDPTFWNLFMYDAYGTTGLAGNGNLVGGAAIGAIGVLGSAAGTIARADNSVGYFLPGNLNGFYGQAMVAAGEGSNTGNGNNRYTGARIGWAGGPFDAAVAVGRTRIPGNSDFRVWNAGASYKAAFATVMAFYHHADYTPAGLPNRFQKFWGLGLKVPAGSGEFRATYQRSDIGGATVIGLRDQDDARQYGFGYVYNLSKRTAIYADVGRIDNRGRSALAYPGGSTAGSNLGVLDDRSSTAVGAGIRHFF